MFSFFDQVAFGLEVGLDGGFSGLGFDVCRVVFETEEEGSCVFDILFMRCDCQRRLYES